MEKSLSMQRYEFWDHGHSEGDLSLFLDFLKLFPVDHFHNGERGSNLKQEFLPFKGTQQLGRKFLQSLKNPPMSHCYKMLSVAFWHCLTFFLSRERHSQNSTAINVIKHQGAETDDQLLIPEPSMVTYVSWKFGNFDRTHQSQKRDE